MNFASNYVKVVRERECKGPLFACELRHKCVGFVRVTCHGPLMGLSPRAKCYYWVNDKKTQHHHHMIILFQFILQFRN